MSGKASAIVRSNHLTCLVIIGHVTDGALKVARFGDRATVPRNLGCKVEGKMGDQQATAEALVLLNAARTVLDSSQRVAVLHQLHELLKREPSLLPTFFPHALGLAVDTSPDLRIGLTRLIEDTVCRMSVPDEVKLLGIAGLKVKAFAMLGHMNDGVKESVLRFLHKLIIVQSPRDAAAISTGTDSVSIDMIPPNHPFINPQELNAEAVGLFSRLQSYLTSPSTSAGPLTANINCMLALSKARPQYLQPMLTTLVQWTSVAPPLSQVQRKSVERTIKVALIATLRSPAAAAYAEILTQALMLLGAKPHELQSARRRELKRAAPSASQQPDGDIKRMRVDTPPEYKPPVMAPRRANRPMEAWNSLDISTLPSTLVAELVVQVIASCSQSRWEEGLEKFRQVASAALLVQDRSQSVQTDLLVPSSVAHVTSDNIPIPVKVEDADVVQRIDPLASSHFDDSETDVYVAQITPKKPSSEPSTPVLSEGTDAQVPPSESTVATPTVQLELQEKGDSELNSDQRTASAVAALQRILGLESLFATEGHTMTSCGEDCGFQSLSAARTGWMQVLSRLTASVDVATSGTRGTPPLEESDLKQVVVDALLEDFRNRNDLAVTWLHHIWVEDERKNQQCIQLDTDGSPRREYAKWFHLILEALSEKLEPKDKTFTKFLIDVPEVTVEAIDKLVRKHCENEERMQLGLFTLQGLINYRPAVREQSLRMLLDYSINPIKLTRATAIVMCKRFFGENRVIGPQIESFALDCINRLSGPAPVSTTTDEKQDSPDHAAPNGGNATAENSPGALPEFKSTDSMDVESTADKMENGSTQGDVVPGEWTELDVVRHLELYFALCSKKHDLLLRIFELYKVLSPSVQHAVRSSIQPLIKALAAQPLRLLPLIRAFPDGSDPLILRVLITMTEKELPSAQLVGLVRNAFVQKNLDARFLIPVLSGLDRNEVLQHLSRIVLLLDGTEPQRKVVRDAFLRLVDSPSVKNAAASATGACPITVAGADRSAIAHHGGAGSPLSPSELLVALHNMDDVVGLKRAVEATNICFSCQTVFKQEVLAVVLQQLVDQSKLPTLFMRTVIQSVNQYSGLVSFVANILLKLINKKMMFPASIHLLQSLPRPPAMDALKRSPKLKASVVQHLAQLKPDQRSRRDMLQLASLVEDDNVQVKAEKSNAKAEPRETGIEVTSEMDDGRSNDAEAQ
ncbi:hypothetical protein PhCBS80983_g00061 [Powellomyces hirtus]|uniref:Symplekin n=1 Tax=Powellomyces hirtus TaxID=109895 RepID=A0A507EII1_9FUNG|nr:hypothetical protein PhCBS80983_g00061 [Powellomyces hirtus]